MLGVQQQNCPVKDKIIHIYSTSKNVHSTEVAVEGSAQFVLDRNFKNSSYRYFALWTIREKINIHLAINLKSKAGSRAVYRGLSHGWWNLYYCKPQEIFNFWRIFDRYKKDFLAAIVNIEKYIMDNYSNQQQHTANNSRSSICVQCIESTFSVRFWFNYW